MATNEDADDGQTEEILRVMREEILKFEEDLIPTVNQWTRDYCKLSFSLSRVGNCVSKIRF